MYVKSTDRNQLLHYDSFHPQGVFHSIPRSQLMRVQEIVSDPQCPEAEVKKERLNLNNSRLSNRHTKIIPFATQLHPFSYDVFNIIKKHWNLLRESYHTIDDFLGPRNMV